MASHPLRFSIPLGSERLSRSVFGVTVQQDPFAYHAVKLTDGTVRGSWHYDYWQAGQETTFSGPVTCMSVSGNRAWAGGPVTESSDPAQVGMGAWWQVADNGTGRHPVIPDRTTFVGIGTMSQPLPTAQVQFVGLAGQTAIPSEEPPLRPAVADVLCSSSTLAVDGNTQPGAPAAGSATPNASPRLVRSMGRRACAGT